MDLILTLGAEGVLLSDLRLRLYDAGAERASTDDLELDALATGVEYKLSGIPDGFWTVTYELPPGVGFSRDTAGPTEAPPYVIIPLREAGQAGAIDLAIFRNEALSGVPLNLPVELGSGSEPGDYLVSGWDGERPGERWLLRWKVGELFFTRAWNGPAEGVPTDVTTFEDDDYAYVRGLFEGWVPDPMPSPNWRGLVQENSAIVPNPVPTGRMEAPTVYGAWACDIDDTEGDFSGTSAPVRRGRLTVAGYTEPGARKGALKKLRAALRRLLDAEEDGPLCFDVQNARVQRIGEVAGGWYVEQIIFPVIGA